MSKPRSLHQLPAIFGVAILLSAAAVAQVSQVGPPPVQKDVFAAVHDTLSDAADRTLALALADKPWMKAPEVAPAGDGHSSIIYRNDPAARIRAAVDRVNHLRPTIEPILREEGVPTNLSAVVLVESGGLTTALSPKGARGVWQFMPDTARRYGLIVSAERDERLDVTKSTHAAARYLRDLYQQFGDWQLAFAAYNAGEQAVERALVRVGQRDFFAVQRSLPQETRTHVPAVLRAISTLGSNTAVQHRDIHSNTLNDRDRVLYASQEENGGSTLHVYKTPN